ncbi:MAG: family 10 glycosylhydrolase [Bacteroidota bacterium]|nr:family 10 glycosylhydrolase [Bacteroidota bacterium]
MSRGLVLLFVTCVFVIQALSAQAPKREFRGVWVATVANIDWPSEPGLSTAEQQKEIVEIVDLHKKNRDNAIILQVRPTADALYSSELEPWSGFLTGEQGKAPDPYYDPLEYWIHEAHKRGMELHAWLNPYRINLDTTDTLSQTHITHEHPEWLFSYGGRSYFYPANPEVWNFVREVVVDVVRRYDVDAIHFDDYFYPYRIENQELPDSLDFISFGGDYYPDRLEEWRRHNVDTIIAILGAAIKAEKPWVKFGISPFGVWRNRSDDERGSETTAGTSNYDGLFADVLHWQKKGWIDYLMPQLYWREDHPAVGFSTLAYWWSDFSYGRHMYVGLAPYRLDRKSLHKQWRKEKYLLRQIDLIRDLEGLDGFAYFSSKHFFRNELTRLNKTLQKKHCQSPALVPEMHWIDSQAPGRPVGLRMEGKTLVWDAPESFDEMDRTRFYAIYRYQPGENIRIKSVADLVELTGESRIDFGEEIPAGTYRISGLDRLNNESQLSDPLVVE